MAGVTAAWRLSEPGWQERFESITIYQRGSRLGGKGASSRGVNGRIEEHGLHVWLGHYDNAFRLLREVYAELDRDRTDPDCPIRSVEDALRPSTEIGLEHLHDDRWHHWIGSFDQNDLMPGAPIEQETPFTATDALRRVLRLVANFYASLDRPATPSGVSMTASPQPASQAGATSPIVATTLMAAVMEAIALASAALGGVARLTSGTGLDAAVGVLDEVLAQLREALRRGFGDDQDALRTWQLISVVLAQTRGVLADGLLGDPTAFRNINDLDFREWIAKHGADPEAVDSTFVLGLYSLVFGFAEGDRKRPGFAAGVGTVLAYKTFFDYRGALFWKMTAGMGDVVFAPLHQALRQRGVRIEYFSRVDELRLSDDHRSIDSVSIPCQVCLAPGRDQYDPLVPFDGLPCFPASPLVDQLDGADGITDHDLESHWCAWPDATERVLRRGVDFDDLIFAIPPGMARVVARELIADSPRWRAMTEGLGIVATRSLQLWLRSDERALGWTRPGTTMTGYTDSFETWSSMPQLLEAEQWPADDRPRAVGYFCNTVPPPTRHELSDPDHPGREHAATRHEAERFIRRDLAHFLPALFDAEGNPRWELLCGPDDLSGPARLDAQYWRANVDPSDLYVQSLPGTDHLRLASDASGYDNLYLAGDWTDNGINAGCIEAAVVSGLRAANAVSGRPMRDRITGRYLD